MHGAVPPSALSAHTPRNRLVSRAAARSAANVLVYMAFVLSLPRRAGASATPGDTVIRARLPPPLRGAWTTDYVCTAVALPADPLKLVKVVPSVVGSATDMLLYGAPLSCVVQPAHVGANRFGVVHVVLPLDPSTELLP